jgi:hypothetical protein
MRMRPPVVMSTFHGHPRAPILFLELVHLKVKARACQPNLAYLTEFLQLLRSRNVERRNQIYSVATQTEEIRELQ